MHRVHLASVAFFQLSTLAPVTSLIAQTVPTAPDVGVEMRLVTGAGAPTRGRLIEWRSDSIVLHVDGHSRAFDSGTLVRAEMLAGRKSRAKRGAVVGLAIGGVAGMLIGLADGSDPPDEWFGFTALEKAAGIGTSLGLVGAGLGAVVGTASSEDRWVSVPLSGRTRGVTAAGRRYGVRVPF